MFHRPPTSLLLCCFGFILPLSISASDLSPYSLYLKLKHQFLQEEQVLRSEDWTPLLEQTFLPISTLEELSERWIKELGWTATSQLLSHQLFHTNPSYEPTQKWVHVLQRQHSASPTGRQNSDSELLHSTDRELANPTVPSVHADPFALPSDDLKHDLDQISPNLSLNDALLPFLHFQKNHALGDAKTRKNHLLDLQNYAQALLLNPPKDFSPTHPSFYYLIDFSVLTAQLPLALEQIQFLLQSWPNDLGLLQRLYRLHVAEMQLDEVKATFVQILSHDELASDWIIAHAQFLKEQRDYVGAIQVMHEALRRRPAPFWVYEQLLTLYPLSQPQPETWHQFALRCARLFPHEAVALYYAGLTSFYVGDTQAAIVYLNHCAEISTFQHPELLNLAFHHALGSACLKEQLWEEALIHFKQGLLGIKEDTSNLAPDCYHGISVSMMALAPENPLIEDFCRKAIEADDQEIRYYLTLADWQIQQKQFSQARETLGKAKALPDLTKVERESITQREKAIP